MSIPVGRRYMATLSRNTLRSCRCEACKEEYVYELTCTVAGFGESYLWLNNEGAQKRARSAAHDALESKVKNAIEPVPCPACGYYQRRMVEILKRESSSSAAIATFFLALILLVVGLWGRIFELFPMRAVVVLLATSFATFTAAWLISRIARARFKPNGDSRGPGFSNPERAKASRGILRKDFDKLMQDNRD